MSRDKNMKACGLMTAAVREPRKEERDMTDTSGLDGDL